MNSKTTQGDKKNIYLQITNEWVSEIYFVVCQRLTKIKRLTEKILTICIVSAALSLIALQYQQIILANTGWVW